MAVRKLVQTAAIACAGFIALLGCAPETATPPAPTGAALSVEKLGRIETVLQDEVDKGLRGGFVALVTDRDGVVYETAVGMADPYNDIPMQVDTRFRIASMTKPVVTAGMMQLVDRGVVRLDDPVALYIPAFGNARVAEDPNFDENGEFKTRPPSRPITIHDLLTHTSGVGYVFFGQTDLDRAYLNANIFEPGATLEEGINKLAALPLYEDPGTVWRYSFSTDIAGRVIEVATGQTLEAFLKESLFEPLGMKDTEFFLDETDFERVAIVNEFDENGEMFRSAGGQLSGPMNDEAFGIMSGGAGLLSTARDYGRFTRMLLNKGALDGVRVLSPATVRLMMSEAVYTDALPGDWPARGLSFGIGGAVIMKPGLMGEVSAKGEWGWSGYWDTWFIVNPLDGVSAVLLAQTQPSATMPPSRARGLVKGIAYGALEE